MLRGSTTENGMRVKLLATMAMGATATRLAARVFAALVLCVCLAGCPGKPTVPLATVPFDVSRKGESVSIPVSVTEENANLEFVYTVAVFLWNPDNDPRIYDLATFPPRQRLYLRIRVWHIVNGSEIAVPVSNRDFDFDNEALTFIGVPSMGDGRTDIAYVGPVGGARQIEKMDSVHFRFQEYGDYRVDVETVADTPLLYAIPSWLTVQRDFRHGK